VAQAAYYRLSCGPDARALPIVSLRMNALAADLCVSVQALRPAIAALVERGLLVTDLDSNPTAAYLPLRMAHEKPRALAHHSAWSSELRGYQWARFYAQAVEDMGFTTPTPPPSLPSTPPLIREREREREKDTDTQQPAAQVPADGKAATGDAGDDYFEELFRSQPQLKKQLAGEGTKEKQTAAILHNQVSAAAAVEWNLRMTKLGNPACVVDRDWAKRNARNVAKVIAAVGGLDNFSMLLAFACAEMPYFAGKTYGKAGQVRAWTMAEWCTRSAIEQVQAGLNSYVQRDTGKPSVCQLDWTRKPTFDLLQGRKHEQD
jgi:hypothetical protein